MSQGRAVRREILEMLAKYNAEGRANLEADAYAADLPDERICDPGREWQSEDQCLY